MHRPFAASPRPPTWLTLAWQPPILATTAASPSQLYLVLLPCVTLMWQPPILATAAASSSPFTSPNPLLCRLLPCLTLPRPDPDPDALADPHARLSHLQHAVGDADRVDDGGGDGGAV